MNLSDLLYAAAGSMSMWRDGAVAGLAGVVIAALYVWVSLVDGGS